MPCAIRRKWGDHAVDDYQARLARTNRSALASGVTTIELVNIDWGPINVDGPSASATTFETWRTSYATGLTEFARDRNVYALVRDGDGAWRVAGNEHPGWSRAGRRQSEPMVSDPASTFRTARASPSKRWAGTPRGGNVHQRLRHVDRARKLRWTRPSAPDAAWVGIGGLRAR